MFGKGVRLFKVLGFEVRIDASWFLLAVLVILSLTQGFFPVHFRNLSPATYWIMGIAGAIGLFMSIIVHELCHSLVARRFGVPMRGITLFMFGGVAQMEDEPQTPKGELLMAIAGPLASIALAFAFTGLAMAGRGLGWHQGVNGVLEYLGFINMVVAIFNLLPAFPLDGGRVLRSLLWAWKKDLRWATRIASWIGSGFGVALIALGVLAMLHGALVGGLWSCLIGMFLRHVSHMSYRQVVIKHALHGEPVRRFMRGEPISVSPDVTLESLVEDYIYQHHFKMFPVVREGGELVGCISTKEVKDVPREAWGARAVGDVAKACSGENTIRPDADATEALASMHRTGNSRLMVVDEGRLAGIIALKDLLKFLSLKLDLEGDGADARAVGDTLDD